ncbi:MAG: hypothetical protein RL154_1267 [Pseudomonadota bacterium]
MLDTHRGRVVHFTPSASFAYEYKGDNTSLFSPSDIISKDGKLYVSNYLGNVHIYDKNSGVQLNKFGISGINQTQMNGTSSIAVDSNSNIHIIQQANRKVDIYSSNGAYLSSYASEVATPSIIRIDSKNGNIYIADAHKGIVYVYDAALKFINSIELITQNNQIAQPLEMQLYNNTLYVFANPSITKISVKAA